MLIYSKAKIKMDKKETDNLDITNDDLSVLRVLLHNVKGISTVSSVPYVPEEESIDE